MWWWVYLPNCELVHSLTLPHRTLFHWGNKICLRSPPVITSLNGASPQRKISNSIWFSYLRQARAEVLITCRSAWRDAILIVRYNCEFYYLLGKNRKHKSKSFVPDVRTKCYGYLISIRDMCFECETRVSFPRWALDLICAVYVRLLYAYSSQMGPRWNPIFCLEESEECAGFLYFKARVIFITESKCWGVAWNHQEEE